MAKQWHNNSAQQRSRGAKEQRRFRWLRLLLCSFSPLLLCICPAQAAHVYFNLSDFGLDTSAHSNRITRLIPQSTPRTSGAAIITSETRVFTNSSTATFLASNLVTGVYKVEIPGRWTTTTFNILAPDDSGTYNATTLLTTTNSMPSASVGYSQASADARFVNLTNHTSTTLTVGTNLLRFTNECYVSYGLDTNSTLSVSNAGLSAVNGLYRTNLLNGYTQGIYKIAWSPSQSSWVISNATQQVYGFDFFGGSNIGDGQAWDTDFLGNPTAPTSWWGPITNCLTVLASSAGLALPMLSSNLYVDATIGNDTNALRGRPDRPWRNLQPALANQKYGDTIFLGPGAYPPLPAYGINFDVSNRCRLIGAGRNVTFIGTEGPPDESIRCGSEVTLRGFTSYGLANIGALGIIATNCVLEECEFNASADAVYVFDFETLLELRRCRLRTHYDGLADWARRPGGSNRVIRLLTCDIYGDVPSSGVIQGITGSDNRIEMFGGSIEAYNGSTRNTCVTLDVDVLRTNKTGSILLSNVRLRHSSTNGLSLMVSNFYNLPVFMDNCTEEVVTGPLTSGSFTNQWWHRNIALGNGSARTNWLVDVTSLTNALVAASEQGHRVTITDDLRTASGTNLYIYPRGTQKINGVLSYTNIIVDGGSMTLMIRSNGWQIISRFP